MIRFAHTYYLYGLLLIPVFIIIFSIMLHWKKKALNRFGDISIISRLIPDVSKGRLVFKFFLIMLAYAFLIVGIANPQIGSKLEKVERKGIDLMIAIDVSNSMLSQDIKPSRLARAKQAVSKLIDNLKGDRIGIIVFAGKAYMQLPITTDYAAAKLFLSTINTEIVPVQGTAIGDAIQLAVGSFDNNNHSKAVIIITDGENHEGNAVEEAKAAAELDIKICTIGMGLPDGAPIPVLNKYGDQIDYKKDKEGKTIITKLDETMLKQIALAGKGVYI
ncbi:MAG: VWA domain-containing protein, partial [Bacteroidetes bacterium]|nr:VWA domain-containing protein [Bacteroidota bacterium]